MSDPDTPRAVDGEILDAHRIEVVPARLHEPIMTVYRWKTGEPRISAPYKPLTAGHLAVGRSCTMCWFPMRVGQRTRLFVTGALDTDDAEAMRAGQWFDAAAEVIHANCDHSAVARMQAENADPREACAVDAPPPTPPAPEAPLGVDPDDFAAMLRYATLGADRAAIDARKNLNATHADITRASVHAAFELALANGLITMVARDQWPRYIAMSPPYTRPAWADGTSVVDEP